MELREIIKKVLHEQGRGGAKPKSSTQSTQVHQILQPIVL